MQNKKSENTNFLMNRLNFNDKYSKNDFHKWMYGHLDEVDYNSVLDVGCGTGKQTFYFHQKKEEAKICSFDISPKSINFIKEKNINNIEAIVGDIDDIENTVKNFTIDKFDLIHSSFSLYYAKNGLKSLRELFNVLDSNGKLIISAPHRINTFLNFLSKYQEIPQLSWDCLDFIDDIVLGFCHNNFYDIKTHLFVNNLFVTDLDDLIENYRSSTFYNEKAESEVYNEAKKIIEKTGYFHIQKNSKILIASKPIS